MKKSVYSIKKHTGLTTKEIERGLFEAADLLLYLEPQLVDTVTDTITKPIHAWMDHNKALLKALVEMHLKQLTKGSKGDDLYVQLYKQQFIPDRFHTVSVDTATEN